MANNKTFLVLSDEERGQLRSIEKSLKDINQNLTDICKACSNGSVTIISNPPGMWSHTEVSYPAQEESEPEKEEDTFLTTVHIKIKFESDKDAKKFKRAFFYSKFDATEQNKYVYYNGTSFTMRWPDVKVEDNFLFVDAQANGAPDQADIEGLVHYMQKGNFHPKYMYVEYNESMNMHYGEWEVSKSYLVDHYIPADCWPVRREDESAEDYDTRLSVVLNTSGMFSVLKRGCADSFDADGPLYDRAVNGTIPGWCKTGAVVCFLMHGPRAHHETADSCIHWYHHISEVTTYKDTEDNWRTDMQMMDDTVISLSTDALRDEYVIRLVDLSVLPDSLHAAILPLLAYRGVKPPKPGDPPEVKEAYDEYHHKVGTFIYETLKEHGHGYEKQEF